MACTIAWCRKPRFFSWGVRVGCNNTTPMIWIGQTMIPTTKCHIWLPSVQHIINNVIKIGWYVKRLNGMRTNTETTRPMNSNKPAFRTITDALSFNDSREGIFITLWLRSRVFSVVIVISHSCWIRKKERQTKWNIIDELVRQLTYELRDAQCITHIIWIMKNHPLNGFYCVVENPFSRHVIIACSCYFTFFTRVCTPSLIPLPWINM